MTALRTVLNGADVIVNTSTAPSLGSINSYVASSGALIPTLPALSGLNVGASMIVEKHALDGTLNTITFSCNGSDTFDDGTAAIVISVPGEKRTLQVVDVSGTTYWKVVATSCPKTGLSTISSAVTLSNTSTNTSLFSTTLPVGTLYTGATFRIECYGEIQTTTTPTLTFTPYIQNTALTNTCVFTSPGTNYASANPFWFGCDVVVRSTGSTGTAISKGWGQAYLVTSAGTTPFVGTTTTTTTIDTSTAQTDTTIALYGQWSAASGSNILTIESAHIERIV
jgi:hypothetical protein